MESILTTESTSSSTSDSHMTYTNNTVYYLDINDIQSWIRTLMALEIAFAKGNDVEELTRKYRDAVLVAP